MNELAEPLQHTAAPRFTDQTVGLNLYPLWEQVTLHQTGEPQPEPSCSWRWSDVQPLVEEAVRQTSTTNSERRVLLMANPAYAGSKGNDRLRTTLTLQGALQILMPGESARPHRHTPNALRVMLEDGGETYTVVDGKECLMQHGDIVLTPAHTWHSHFHRGTERSVWFDALDSGLSALFDAAFFEPGSKLGNFPVTMADRTFVSTGLSPVLTDGVPAAYSPFFRFPWADTLAALDAAPSQEDGSVWLRLINPAGGAMAMPPMDCFTARVTREPTRARRTTASGMCIVVRGSGVSKIGDKDVHWGEHDVFTLPHWAWVSHRALSDDAVLFIITDRGALDLLGFLKEEQN